MAGASALPALPAALRYAKWLLEVYAVSSSIACLFTLLLLEQAVHGAVVLLLREVGERLQDERVRIGAGQPMDPCFDRKSRKSTTVSNNRVITLRHFSFFVKEKTDLFVINLRIHCLSATLLVILQ